MLDWAGVKFRNEVIVDIIGVQTFILICRNTS